MSFEGSGRIASIAVDVGDTVRRGQTLARLDPEPAQLKLQQARADVSAANAQKAERELNFRQQQALFDCRIPQLDLTSLVTVQKAREGHGSRHVFPMFDS
jgi:multidrug resistance efflux pump